MHIKDHSAAMKFFRTYDNVASKGKWKEFVDEMEFDSVLREPRFMAQGGRPGYQSGQLVDHGPGRQGYAGKGTEQRVALSQWLKTQDKTISREALTKQVAKIWNTDSSQKVTSYLLKENPDLFKNTKILSLSDVKGTTDFRNYLKTTKKRSTTVSQLVEDFKKATGKTVNANVGNIGTEFSEKFNLQQKQNQPPNKIEQKAINTYKKLSQEQKFAFQVGGPSQKGVYAKWLTDNGLDSGNTGQRRFRNLLEREGLYQRKPIRTPVDTAKKAAERSSGIGTSGATTYEQDLVKFKKETLKNLGITADRVPFDQAHRLSFKHMARLGENYAASNIGTDFHRTNTSAARKLEIALEPLYDKQYNIWKKAKKNPSKELSKSLDKVNNQIAELVAEKSNGRIQGIQIDPYNLKVGSTPINYKYAADLGTTKKPLSQITKGSSEDIAIKLNYPEQIKKEALESGLIKKAPKNIPFSPRKYSAAAVTEELINHPLAGKAGNLARKLGLEFEAAFIALEFMNNLSKGIEPGESFQRSLQSASVGLYKGGDRKLMENVKKAAEELGFDPRVMGSLMKINERGYKEQKELARDENLIAKYTEYAENNPDQADKAYKAIEELKERRKKDYETWGKGTDVLVKEYFTNLKRSKKTMNITNEDINQSVENLQRSALSKVEKERIAKAKEKSTQVDVEAGKYGDVIQNTIGGIFTYPKYAFDVVNPLSPLPKWGGWKTEGMKEKERIEDMQEKGAPGELYRYNIDRGYDIDKPLTAQAVQSEIAERPFFGWKAEGGRVSFSGGGIDKGRRAFMKLLAALGIGTATVGTGLIKLGGKAVGKKAAVQAGVDIATSTPGMPSWFPALVNKIIKEGDDVTAKLATTERQVVHTKKIPGGDEATVYQNLDTGNITVEYGGPLMNKKGQIIRASNDPEVIHLEYRAGEVIEEGAKKGKKTKPEFSAAEAEPEVVNWDGDIEMSGINEVNKVEDLVTPTNKLQEFATNKKLNIRDRLKLERQQKYKKKLETDKTTQIDYVESKRGPMPDPGDYGGGKDETIDVFAKYRGEKASGGRVSYFDGGIVSLKKKW